MPNNYKDALEKIATLVGYKFNDEVTKVEFERVALEGGEVFITNQSEGDLTLGDTIYIETEEGFEPAVSGVHRLDDGREIVLDEESVLVEVREEGSEEEEVVEEVVEETSEEEEMGQDEITQLKEAIHDLLMTFNNEIEAINNKFNSFVEDYNEFKQSESITPVKQESKVNQDFSKMRLEIINKMKSKK